MKIICISDTNNDHSNIQQLSGDILIHCGDFTKSGTEKQVYNFLNWLSTLQFKHKVIICGHKEYSFDVEKYQNKLKKIFHNGFPDYDGQVYKSQLMTMENVYYLEHEIVEIEGIRIFGSPYQPLFQDLAFGRENEELEEKWNSVEEEKIDILVTHCGPYGVLDLYKNTHTGCKAISNWVKKNKPKYHVFGHSRESYGKQEIEGTTFVNCCRFNEQFKPINEPIVI